ncbi:hypothetical protein PMG11_04158 [Penicillium brasilianum]|uniref:Cytochrome b5 heme-binding domain-containing protein n=1 Tax=Penicillium brasilianum TaxID=104259 RepID=A0A0F7VBX0_PENBI|nr:hypothetical protein PMG11_04158 [Penicillium brasilianum]
MSELRQRQTATSAGSARHAESTTQRKQERRADGEESHGLSLLDIIRIIATLILASCGLSYYITNSESLLWGYRPWFTRWPVVKTYLTGPVNLTPAELSLYNGSDPSLPIYLVVNGSIFDVSANPAIYGPGGSYNFFTGRDATRAFVTGCFKEDLTPDLIGAEELFVPVEDVEDEGITRAQKKIRREREVRLARTAVEKTVDRWEGFFRNHKKYFQVGRVLDDGVVDLEKGKRVLCESAQKQRPKRSEMKEEA